MALIENTDYVAVKKAGYYDGRRTLQQHGNIIDFKLLVIFPV